WNDQLARRWKRADLSHSRLGSDGSGRHVESAAQSRRAAPLVQATRSSGRKFSGLEECQSRRPAFRVPSQGPMNSMRNSCKLAITTTAAAVCAALLFAPPSTLGQEKLDEKARAAKAKQIQQIFENNARELTFFDCTGKMLKSIGPR